MITSGTGNGLCWSVWKRRAASAVIWYVEKEGKLDFESKLVDDVSVFGTWCMLLIATGDGGSMELEKVCCCWSSVVLDADTVVGGDDVCRLLFAEGWGVRVGSTTATACEYKFCVRREEYQKWCFLNLCKICVRDRENFVGREKSCFLLDCQREEHPER